MRYEERPTRFLFISLNQVDYSRSGVLFSSLKSADFVQISGTLIQRLTQMTKLTKNFVTAEVIIVMSPSHYLAIVARLITHKKIILDAGWPLSDSSRLRIHGIHGFLKYFKDCFLDFLSFHSAHKVVVESAIQKERLIRYFLVREKKIDVIYTSFDESRFETLDDHSGVSLDIQEITLSKKKKVIFRGKSNPESGLALLAKTSHLLDDTIQLVVVSTNLPPELDFSNSTIIISRPINYLEMAKLYKSSILTLGQLGDSSRQQWTIPHKFFESAYFGKAYLSKHSSAIEELVDIQKDFTVGQDICASELAKKINTLVNEEVRLKIQSAEMHEAYRNKCSQVISRKIFLDLCEEFIR